MFVNLQTILFQAGGASPMPSLFIMVGMIVVMYFFMIRPQAKRAKEQKKFAESIGAGEKIITTAGIHGTIQRINEDGTLQIEVGRGMFMTVERSAVSMELTAAYKKKTEAAATALATK
ncbi:MAG TPA: preprotein translocase subunit YajC [Flavipsychrobacter sp.]|nr:preprotein translocase subunit YajC [Flavipsychrobacter sp.]